MNAVDYAAGLLGDYKHVSSGRELNANCPFCGETRHRFFINVGKQSYYCHNCQASGGMVSLVAHLEGVSVGTAIKTLKEQTGFTPEVRQQGVKNFLRESLTMDFSKFSDVELKPIPLPDGFTLLDDSQSSLAGAIRKYLYSRGLNDQTITRMGIGFSNRDIKLKGRAIIPITYMGEVVFWVARASSQTAYLKEVSPENKETEISKSKVVFNLEMAASTGVLVISEGIFDAVSWGRSGVGLLGKILSDYQFELICQYKSDIDTIYVALDDDAKPNAVKLAKKLSEVFPDIRLVSVSGDPNDHLRTLGKRSLMETLATAEKYSKFSALRHKLQG